MIGEAPVLAQPTRRKLLAALVVAIGAVGCGSEAQLRREVAAVKAVTWKWLRALAVGDGQTYCSVLSRRLRNQVDQAARLLGEDLHRRISCAEANSADPPGTPRDELPQLELARRQSSAGLRIDRVTVNGNRATVAYSWLVPAHPSRVMSFKRPARGNRVDEVATLDKQAGAWRIG